MGYYTGEDLPFHWALAQSFTLADNYHCSVMGPTDANRLFWEKAGMTPRARPADRSWKPAASKTLPTKPEPRPSTTPGSATSSTPTNGAYNSRANYFRQFQAPGRVPEALYSSVFSSGTLYGDGTPGGIGNPLSPTLASTPSLNFEEDCANGVLPDVSFLGTGGDEHPPDLPAQGAQYIARKLEALAANEELWNTTLFVINYDENDGFFDHVVPPTPDPEEYPEEFVTLASPAGTPGGGLPIGAGFRVPCIIISPWTVGGRIFSEVSDHTSCLRLIEAVAAAGGLSGAGPVTFPNISRWRRKTFSDFTAALRGAAQPAPTNTQFDPATTAANLAAQEVAARQPQTPRPGATQQFPFEPRK